MRLSALFKKSLLENFRDWKIIVLTLTFAPFFVYLMYFYLGASDLTSRVVIVNLDQGFKTAGGNTFHFAEDLMKDLKSAVSQEGRNIIHILEKETLEEARALVKKGSADLILEIPPDFSRILWEYRNGRNPGPAVVKTHGDQAKPAAVIGAAWTDYLVGLYVDERVGIKGPLAYQAEDIPGMESSDEFELYVPALLALALMMLMFTAAASLIKEKDKLTILRLRLSNMTSWEWFSAVSLSQIIIGMVALGLAYLSAVSVGYSSSGSLLALAVVGILSCLAIMAISLIVAALLRTIFDLMTIGCFPFFILMFFSGGMLPLAPVRIFAIGNRSLNINDILPTTHSISAFGKILNRSAGLEDIGFELAAIAILTIIYFALGTWLFVRRHLHPK